VTASSLEPPADELVTIEVSTTGPAVVLAAAGEIDSTSAPVLLHHLDTVLDGGDIRELTVDLGHVTFLDSAGLCVLATAHRRTVHVGVTMRVLASSRAVIRPLQITGLWQLLRAEQIPSDDRLAESAGAA
jgi:anti-sigma B factor antagonist